MGWPGAIRRTTGHSGLTGLLAEAKVPHFTHGCGSVHTLGPGMALPETTPGGPDNGRWLGPPGPAVPGPGHALRAVQAQPPRGQPRRNSTGASASEPIGVIFNMMTPS